MKNSEIPEVHKLIFKKTAKKLHGAERREYIAMITIKLLDGNARKAESVFGWGRATVKKGMRELATGINCIHNYSLRGNKKTEEKIPQLAEDIRAIVDPKSQADPHFQKTKTLKKIPETDAIFENVDEVKRKADESSETLRISIDTKAKVNIGEFSRGGKTRKKEPEKEHLSHIKELVINLDNGPHIQSHRTQFINRMVEFVDKTRLLL